MAIDYVVGADELEKHVTGGYLVIEFKKGKETKDPADPSRSYPEHEMPDTVSQSRSYAFYSHQHKWREGNFIVKIIGKTITGTAHAPNLLFGGSHEYTTGPTEELDAFELIVMPE